ncbi:hypothetical protein XENOCAPTIV_030057 [Xenoophorus captivus]|uniref:I-kappa-kinase-beta NEMO binding domain-containing protein n=1 Tax=Xenoophorus captivus TaxID=1517983 RepID=A0ABV0RVT7_9TELE
MAASPESSRLLQVSQWSQSAQPVSSPHPLTSLPGRNDSDAAPRLLQENQKYLSQLTNLMQEAADEQAKSIVSNTKDRRPSARWSGIVQPHVTRENPD